MSPMEGLPRKYQLDHDWVWSPCNQSLQKQAVLRVEISCNATGVLALRCARWLQGLDTDGTGEYWHGGWGARIASQSANAIAVELSSSGEDVAGSLQAAADSLYAAVVTEDSQTSVRWRQLPLRDR